MRGWEGGMPKEVSVQDKYSHVIKTKEETFNDMYLHYSGCKSHRKFSPVLLSDLLVLQLQCQNALPMNCASFNYFIKHFHPVLEFRFHLYADSTNVCPTLTEKSVCMRKV